MKQVKELSMVQSVSYSSMLHNDLGSGNYAVGFAAADFIIWNLITEAKVFNRHYPVTEFYIFFILKKFTS